MPRSPRPAALSRCLALAAGVALAVAAAELAFRLHPPRLARLAGEEPAWAQGLSEAVSHEVLTQDPELGYRPLLGGRDYAEHGALRNEYALEKPAGVRRVLFLGDSATRRGKLVAALREAWGSAGYEYWNAGVEGYAPVQELGYYRRYLGDIRADHVVLTLHPNDFETTPLSFFDRQGKLHLYWARLPLAELSPWLLRHSWLYRFLVGWRLRRQGAGQVEAQVEAELVDSLEALAALTRERGARLSLLLLPRLEPLERWPAVVRERHAALLAHLARLGLEHHDLTPAIERARGEDGPLLESPGDVHHPGTGFARAAAALLREQGFEL